MSDEDLTAGAVELAERILEAVTAIDQDWRTVSACARELASMAEAVAAAQERPRPEED